MTTTMSNRERQKGRFSVEVELTNGADIIRAKDGHISLEQVRRVPLRGVVDSGETRLVIPAAIAAQLGLEIGFSVKVRGADRRIAGRPVARNILLKHGGRDDVFSAVVDPDRELALIGIGVLQVLDFLVVPVGQRLVPRDPDRIISEAE